MIRFYSRYIQQSNGDSETRYYSSDPINLFPRRLWSSCHY